MARDSRLSLTMGLRYEFMTTPTDATGGDYAYRNILTDKITQQGILKNYTLTNLAPRVGFAYDVTGTARGRRFCAGVWVFQDVGNLGQVFFQNAYGTPPNASSSSVTNTGGAVLTLPLTFPVGTQGARVLTNQYDARQPYTEQFNVTLGQQLPGNVGVTVAYVGLRGHNIWNTVEGNPVAPTSLVNGQPFWDNSLVACANVVPSCRQNPNIGSVFYVGSFGKIWYDGLQVTVDKRLSHGFQTQAAYTWSRTIDTYQANGGNNDGGGTRLYPFDDKYDKGPAFTDVPRALRLSVVYEFPHASLAPALAALVNGWRMAHIVQLQDGYPFTPMLATDRARAGNLQSQTGRVDLGTSTVGPGQTDSSGNVNTTPGTFIPYDPNTVITGDPNQWFNPYMFRLSPLGSLGNATRNFLRGPGLFSGHVAIAGHHLVAWGRPNGASKFSTFPTTRISECRNNTVFALKPDQSRALRMRAYWASNLCLEIAGRIATPPRRSRQIRFCRGLFRDAQSRAAVSAMPVGALIAVCALGTSVQAGQAARSSQPVGGGSGDVNEGRRYQAKCSVCHVPAIAVV